MKSFGPVGVVFFAFAGTAAHADWPPTGSTGPDVIVGDMPGVVNFASVGTIDAFAAATTSCSIGSADIPWQGLTNLHPVIGQNLYRLKDGRFEQIGMSWLKHGFAAVNDNTCTHPSLPPCTNVGSVLGVGCSDPYAATLNGDQDGNGGVTGGLGPHFDVNPTTGAFPFPYSFQGVTGNTVFKRLQVHHADLDPALNAGALYFVEAHYVTPDDALAGNGNNNASYRRLIVTGAGEYTVTLTDSTERCQAGIRAWQDQDATVDEVDVQVPGDGLFILAAKATDVGGGFWRYEYAVQNLNSDRSAGSFSVPIDPTASVTNIGFHDVDYHSGEPYSLADWTGVFAGSAVSWSTDDYGADPDANALRWSTLYNFRFDANVPPDTATVTLALFKPGSPGSVDADIVGPAAGPLDCNSNSVDDIVDIANNTSADCNGNRVPDECEAPCNLTTVPVVVGLSGSPVFVVAPPGDFDRLFIVEQDGHVKILDLNSSTLLGTDFLNISGSVIFGGERGLFSLAFRPDYTSNGLFYINYTNLAGDTVVAQYSVSGDPDVADAGSAVILRTISQDFANHNGGQLQFGPDGKLYVGMGDGGSSNDPLERAQDDGSLLGKMLRLDVDNPPTYIPADNPASMPLPEVWAKGLRNPWRFSFDRLTGDLYIADVGQDSREEINFQPAGSAGGENYGWDCREGIICAPGNPGDVGCSCAGSFTDPILDVAHGTAGTCSITGGYVYRGCGIPHLSGTYFYADYCGGWIRSFVYRDGDPVPPAWQDRTAELQPPGGGPISSIVSFGEDAAGELYIVSNAGNIYKIVCDDPAAGNCGNGLVEPGENCDPPNGISCDCQCHTAGCDVLAFEDNFETDTGWTVANLGASSGDWERGVPVNDPGWADDPISDSDGSGQCYLTQNAIGNTDVDGGSVQLRSPTIDMSSGDVSIRYDYYLRLTNQDGSDRMLVEISSNGDAGPWIEIALHDTDGGSNWRYHEILQSDLDGFGVTLTANMRLQFTVNDADTQSIVEAGLDAFRVCRGEGYVDCNLNCVNDADDIAAYTSFDCDFNGIPDECEGGTVASCDCNENGVNDAIDLSGGASQDCNSNLEPDECDIAAMLEVDCDGGPVGIIGNGDLLLNTFCFGCHNTDGTGGGGFPGPNIRGKSRVELWNKLLPPTDHPGGIFPGFSQQNFADLEAFLADGGSRGRPDLVPDNCQAMTADCDGDLISDACELEAGSQVDSDYDGVPDNCTCQFAADGDVNGDSSVDGIDVASFVGALIGGNSTQAQICAGDFDGMNGLDEGDIPGLVGALLSP